MSLLKSNFVFTFYLQNTKAESSNSRKSFEELCDATDCFSSESTIGVGTTGITYEATLRNGCFVAVKRLYYDSQLRSRQFQAEIMILERCKHRNIVPLLWFWEEEVEIKARILVYQYLPNGRLSDFLSVRNDDVALSWPVRIRIALGIARGLFWLHHIFHVVHFNIRSECILLDQKFEPKISNFGEAKFINQNIGNDRDKSFHLDNRSSNEFGFEKIDVYNFGTVLLELISGKRFNPRTDSFVGNGGSVVVTGTTCLSRSPSGFHEAIDKFLIGKGFDDEIFTLLTIACYCIQPFLDQRPTMLEVYTKMSNIWERHELGEDSEISKKSEVASATTSRDEIVEIESM